MAVAAFAIGLACIVGTVALYRAMYRDRVYGGVSVAGTVGTIDIGGQTRDEALQTLAVHYERFLAAPVVLRHLGREWRATPRDLGAHIELAPTVDAALQLGREGDRWERMAQQATGIRGGLTLPRPLVTVDDERLSGFVSGLAPAVERAPTSADLALKPEGGVTVLASQSGRRLNVRGSVNAVATALREYQVGAFALEVEDVLSELAEADLAEVRARAATIIGAPVVLRADLGAAGVKTWTMERGDLIELLELKATSTRPPRYELRVDEERIRRYVEQIAPEIERPARDARFALEGRQFRAIRESEEGRRLEVTASINLIRQALTSSAREVQLPWVQVRPAFPAADAPKLSFPDRIELASTAYGGTLPERMHNVELAAARITGVVVAPGETFSFNDEVGEVSYRSGYKRGYGISQENGEVVTIPSEGGGICQVATTLFQSVFWGGYPIVERNWHLYWIPRYGARPRGLKGLDATIDQVYDSSGKLLYAVDLQWRNNTEAPILVTAETDGKNLTVALWGRKPLWQVKVAEPKIEKVVKADTRAVRQHDASMASGGELMIERAEDGFQATIVRTIVMDGKIADETRLVSTYRPSRNVYLYGGPVARVSAVAGRSSEDRPAMPAPLPTSMVTPYAGLDRPAVTVTPSRRTGTVTVTEAASRTATPRVIATPTR